MVRAKTYCGPRLYQHRPQLDERYVVRGPRALSVTAALVLDLFPARPLVAPPFEQLTDALHIALHVIENPSNAVMILLND